MDFTVYKLFFNFFFMKGGREAVGKTYYPVKIMAE